MMELQLIASIPFIVMSIVLWIMARRKSGLTRYGFWSFVLGLFGASLIVSGLLGKYVVVIGVLVLMIFGYLYIKEVIRSIDL